MSHEISNLYRYSVMKSRVIYNIQEYDLVWLLEFGVKLLFVG